jgi:hypothetical protein
MAICLTLKKRMAMPTNSKGIEVFSGNTSDSSDKFSDEAKLEKIYPGTKSIEL